MFKSMRYIRQRNKEYKRKALERTIFNEKSEAVVNVKVSEDTTIISPFCTDYSVLEDSFASFLEQTTEFIPIKHNLEFVFHSDKELSDNKKQEIKKTICQHYESNATMSVSRNLKSQAKIISLAIVGLLLLALEIVLEYVIKENVLFLRAFDIIAAVFLWEATDLFILERSGYNLDMIKNIRLSKSNITFIVDKKGV